jgi:hypothetical protein
VERALVLSADGDNPDVGDLYLAFGRTTVLTSDLAYEVAQRIRVRFNLFKGELFTDLNVGVPYLGVLFEKAVPDRTIRSVLGQIIAGTEGVAALDSLEYTIDSTRLLSVVFSARLQDGTTFRSSTYGPFVIEVT